MKGYSQREAAKQTGVPQPTLHTWAKRGLIVPEINDDGKLRYSEAQLQQIRELRAERTKPAQIAPETVTETTLPEDDIADNDNSENSAPDETAATLPASQDFTADAEQFTRLDEKPLPVLESEIKFHLERGTQHFIEAGRRLIAAKKFVAHGQWHQWLEKFSLKRQFAQNLMAVAERFGANYHTYGNLSYSAFVAMTALPVGDEQAFIDKQAEDGKPVESQSARKIQEHVKEWNKRRKPETSPVVAEPETVTNELPADDSTAESGEGELKTSGGENFSVEDGNKICGIADAGNEFDREIVQSLLEDIAALIRHAEPRFVDDTIKKLRSIRDNLRNQKDAVTAHERDKSNE